ncbi:monovalent cation/H+ antiporter subunit D family protein [Elusimicrobiota bacterium]
MMEHLPVLVVVIPLIVSVIVPLIGRLNKSYCWYAAMAVTFFCFVSALSLTSTVMQAGRISYWLGGWEPPWGIEISIDYLNAFVLCVVAFISFAVSVFSKKSIEAEIGEDRFVTFYTVFMLFITGLMGIVVTGDIFNLYVFIEIASLSGYALIAVGKRKEALMASYNYLILGTIGATFILLGIGYLYMVTGTLNMADLQARLPQLYHSKTVLTAFAFFTVGLSIKLALFPLHIWLPNAYTYAPSVVSALMAATATKVGAYAMLRIMFTVFNVEFDLEIVPVSKILSFISAIAILAGSIFALAQTNIKRMLAYSSVGQIGYIVLGATLANEIAMTGSIMHVLNHSLMKACLFLVVGAVVYKTGVDDISGFKGLGKKMPISMAAFTIAALSMIGVPFTVGFVSKWYIAVGALEAGKWYFVPIVLASSLLTVIYMWRVIELIYFPPPHADEAQRRFEQRGRDQKINEAPWTMLVPIVVIALLCVFFGMKSSVPMAVAGKAAGMLLN